MEGKGRGGGAQAANTSTTTTITTTATTSTTKPPEVVVVEQQQQQQGPRRRAGALKRKANNSTTSSTPAKRLARERSILPLPPLHNGPITRAHEELQPDLESVIDADFEAIRSRDDNAHVIPTHAGWFSWTKVHPLEEHALASFFNGKSEKRTPDDYMEIRNLIVKKFHEDSKTQIEPKDLSELSVGELDARQEVMEFLDHWGLINFQPFPLADSGRDAPDGTDKTAALIEKLYRFETVQSRMRVGSRAELAAPTMPPRLFPESSIAEEVRPEGPSVEYHCNSCSADCSRKRYHCQKQADFDLCSECYNNGKFDTGMSHADFILMESAEVPGVSGGSWTDQETLLLLEALELFGENWNEIAEHVATKTKAQCILHFVQMPIEDTFFEVKDDIDASLQANIVPGSTGNDSSGLKDASETRDSTVETNNDSASVKSNPETTEGKSAITSDSSALKDAPEIMENKSGNTEEQPLYSPMDISKPSDASEVKLAQEISANIALNALKEAFQAVGSLPEPGEKLSFAEAGNPVMALAAYLAGLVEPDVAAASARNSLKTITEESPGIQLAARHCFILEDSPDGVNVTPAIESTDVEMADKEVQKDENQKDEEQKDENQKDENQKDEDQKDEDQKEENHLEENHTSVLDGSNVPKNCPDDEKMVEAIQEEKESLFSSGDEGKENSNAAKKPDDATILQDGTPSAVKEPGDAASPPREDPPSTVTESVDMPFPAEVMPSSMKKSGDGLGEASKCPEVPKAVDTVSNSVPSEEKESQQTVAASLTVENEANTGKDDIKVIDSKEEKNCDLTESKDDLSINRIKRAAITALSAAAVKAKLLANQEEDQIRQIATLLIEKQLHKLEIKLSFFTEMESVLARVREQMDRSRQRLYQERAHIIASRLGLPASSSRTGPPSLATNRVAMSYVNSVPRLQPGMNFQRLPVKTTAKTSAPHLSSSSVPSTVAASPHISQQEKLSSLGTS
ncbi:zinc finger protein [Macleaya cordata]|uniref:Zinc finger protein n=1 Tax=Macleaya cordata TaxID=56857 RepID=A0A200Q236_MACCD|nr:zinc finger protein [Macleaya cordata]